MTSSILWLLLLLASCAHPFGLRYPPARWVADDDARPIDAPAEPVPFLYPDEAPPGHLQDVEMLFELTARVAELPTAAIPGGTVEALNVDNFDEAPDSSWFINRIGRREMTDAEFVGGAGAVDVKNGGRLEVTALGRAIAADWLAVSDGSGNAYLLTLDRLERPELATAAGLIVGRILFAAGYNVPASSLSDLDPRRLVLAPSATFRDFSGEVKPASGADLDALLKGVARSASGGTVRVLATARPAGTPMGPFSSKGRRHRDPNDRIAHQHRRELRGLDAIASWLDLRTATADHTADFFVAGADGRGHLVHYLVGFEAALGNFDAALQELAPPEHPSMKLKPVSLGLPSVTLYTRRMLAPTERPKPCFCAEHFDPGRWEPAVPNPAMWIGTGRDGLWGAALLSKFTDARLAALLDAAKLSGAATRARLLAALTARRDKVMAFWFGKTNPVGSFSAAAAPGGALISFEDFAASAKLAGTAGSSYRWRLRTANGRSTLFGWSISSTPEALIKSEILQKMDPAGLYALQLQTVRPDAAWPTPSVEVFLRKDASEMIALQGLARRKNN